jgi:hypothetical protein
MPRRKKERGRPSKPYPPRIDATPEEALRAMFNAPPSTAIEHRESRCSDCGREVYYPDILYRDNRCSECHAAVPV